MKLKHIQQEIERYAGALFNLPGNIFTDKEWQKSTVKPILSDDNIYRGLTASKIETLLDKVQQPDHPPLPPQRKEYLAELAALLSADARREVRHRMMFGQSLNAGDKALLKNYPLVSERLLPRLLTLGFNTVVNDSRQDRYVARDKAAYLATGTTPALEIARKRETGELSMQVRMKM